MGAFQTVVSTPELHQRCGVGSAASPSGPTDREPRNIATRVGELVEP